MSTKLYTITIRERDGRYETEVEYHNEAIQHRPILTDGKPEFAGGGGTPHDALYNSELDDRIPDEDIIDIDTLDMILQDDKTLEVAEILKEEEGISASDIDERVDFSSATVYRHLERLEYMNFARREETSAAFQGDLWYWKMEKL